MRLLDLTPAVQARLLRARTGRDPAAERVAARIIADVRRRGDEAVRHWTRRLDGGESGIIGRGALRAARRSVSRTFLAAVRRAARNIRLVAEAQLPRPWEIEVEPGVRVGQMVRPLDAVGCYVPGGRYPLVSTLLMTAIPAQVAGVRRIVVACPRPGSEILAAADELGLTEVRRMGGAQAIAALAYGTATLAPVDRIVGPGNRWVAAAKRLVSMDCPIDVLAGPTEVLLLADRGDPRALAADLLAQAEHDPEALALMVTTSRSLAAAVRAEVAAQLAALPEPSPARAAIAGRGAILVARDLDRAVAFANALGAEHLWVPTRAVAGRITCAGSVFVGRWTAQSAGDFATGSNHTLPTAGAARARGGLSAADFVRCISIQTVTRAGLVRLAPVVAAFAEAEGLPAHGAAVTRRLPSRRAS
jgi:histidinol dehydrogenase